MLKYMTRKEGEKGFTLVELIVVMAILAVLATLAVPRFANVLGDSKNKAHNANVAMIEKAIEMSNANGDLSGIVASGTSANLMDELVTDKYLKSAPKDPRDNTTVYTVTVTADASSQITAITVTPAKVP
jgi:type IV pilus assembly protein PilA